jgi:tetratricopeptide (TPR) repeat protein
MRARAADADGAGALAARDYAAALTAAPDNPLVAVRAYREAVEVGDDALADRAAAVLRAAGAAPADAALGALAGAARAGDAAGATRAIAELEAGPLKIVVPALRGWLALEEGRDPLPPLAAAGRDLVAKRLATENRALLLLASGKRDAGLAALTPLLGTDQAALDLRFAAAQLLAATGHAADADRLLATGDEVLAGARGRLGPPVRPGLAFGASRLFIRLATDLQPGEPSALSVALARAALRADPAADRARLLLANQLSRTGQGGRALVELAQVRADGPFGVVARSARVTVLAAGDDAAATLAAAAQLAGAATASPYDIQRYGDRLMAVGRPADAAKQYARVLRTDGADWSAWLQYGGALDEAGRWPEARAALEKAVALGPDEPLALNYLGYARIEHGEAVAASRAMLEKAARLKPEDASIADSLAWAYYRAGEVGRALPMLERAWQGEPDNPTIAEHLGDAYWSAGRRWEARYAWRAAQTVADAADARRLSAKIDHGLGTARRR